MIPKIIHMCWFGDEIPSVLYEYIQSWVFHLWKDGYEVMIWDNSNVERFLDKPIIRFLWDNKRYAFLADYVRCRVLYEYGGIYLDTDVKVMKSFDDILHLKTFIGLESYETKYDVKGTYQDEINDHKITNAIIGTYKGNELFKTMYEWFEERKAANFIYNENNREFFIFPEYFTYYIKNQTRYAIVNSIKEAEMLENEGIIPIFNFPYFDVYDINVDYSFCYHKYTNLWTNNLDKIYCPLKK